MEKFDYLHTLKIKELLPPKFANNNWIDGQMASVIDGDSKCDVIWVRYFTKYCIIRTYIISGHML